jgi:lysophospholipase L1-like esterase
MVVFGLAVAVLITEGVLRIPASTRHLVKSNYAKFPDITRSGTYLPWELRPGSVDRHIDPHGEFDCEFRINSLGLRDREIDAEKRPGVFRILFLGDSMTVGWGVEADEAFAKRVEQILNNHGDLDPDDSPPAYETLNCGWASWFTTDGAHVFLRHRLAELEPDLVVLAFFLNDPAELSLDDWRPLGAALPESLAKSIPAEPTRRHRRFLRVRVQRFLEHHSYVYNLIRDRLAGALRRVSRGVDLFTLEAVLRQEHPAASVALFTEHYPPLIERRLQLTEELLIASRDLTLRHGSEFAVVIVPADFQLVERKKDRYCILPIVFHDQRFVPKKAQQVVTAICERNAIPVFDLLEPLSKASPEDCFFRADPHLTPRGHAVAAGAIAGFLEREGLLDHSDR